MKKVMSSLLAAAVCMGVVMPSHAEQAPSVMPKVFSDGDSAVHKRVENMHKTRYIEIFLAAPDAKTGEISAACYNTMFTSKGIPPSKDTAPQKLVKALNFQKIAKEYGVVNASLNGPKIWLPDWTEIDVGEIRHFNGIEAPWVAQLDMGHNKQGVAATKPYTSIDIARKSGLGWNKGTKVVLLDDAEGNTWVMKGFQLGMDPKYTYEGFIKAGASMFKKLPAGWKVRIATLDKDLIERPENGIAKIMADEHFNVYDKTGPGMMNYKP